MENSSEVKNIKREPNDEWKMPIAMRVDLVKEKTEHLTHAEITGMSIKTEEKLDETELPVFASISNEVCPNYCTKIEADERVVYTEEKNLFDQTFKDSLDVSHEIKVDSYEEHLSSFESEDGVEEEKYKLVKDEMPVYKCSNHKNQIFKKNEQIFKNRKLFCNVCHKLFSRKSDLEVHFRIHTGEKPFTCHICNKSFNVNSSLNKHIILHSGEKPHACDVCNKNFSRKSNLNSHKLIHMDMEKSHICSECNKSFRIKNDLVRHQRVHTGDKPYACNICEKTFKQKAHVMEHKSRHSGEKPFSCDVCNKFFARQSDVNRHKKIHNS